MKALLSKTIGAPESLVVGHVSDPVPGDDEILITVKACGVNFPDTLIIEDKYQFKPERPFSPGGEVAGIVAEVGQNISGIRPGDRVIGWCTWGEWLRRSSSRRSIVFRSRMRCRSMRPLPSS